MPDGSSTTPTEGARRARSSGDRPLRSTPNYTARRMLVGTAVITLAFAAGVVGWRLASGGGSSTDPDRASWSSIAFVDRTNGDVTAVDTEGSVTAESPGHGRTSAVYAYDGVLSLANATTLTVLRELDDTEPLTVDLPSRADIAPVRTPERTYLALGSPTGGDVVIVDPTAGTVIDIGELAATASPTTPKMYVETMRTNRDGSMFAIADAANFQTIVVLPDQPEPVFLADQPIAVGTDLIATTQTVGLQADLSILDLERDVKASASTEIPAGAIGVMTDDTLTIVSVEGGVFRLEPGDDEAARLGAVAVPTGELIQWVRPTASGDRLVVAGETFEAVVDLDGRTLFTTTFPSAVDVPFPDPVWSCLPVGGTGGYHSIIDLTTGEQLADLSSIDEVLGTSDDGCTVLADRVGVTEVIDGAGSAIVGAVDRAVMGPDGRSVVRVTDDTVELLILDDELVPDDPIDLSDVVDPRALIAFVPD